MAYRCARSDEVLISRTVARDISGRRPDSGLYRCASDLSRNFSSVRLSDVDLLRCIRSWKRFHRTLTGASMLTSMKNGRRRSLSSIDSVCMSVVTHRSLHCVVTKSSKSSAVLKVVFEEPADLCRDRVSADNSSDPFPTSPLVTFARLKLCISG